MTSGQPANKPNWHHYSISERIHFLRKCESDRSWISRHDRKIRRSIAIYLAGILLIGALGYTLNWGDTGKKLNAHLFEQVLLREIEKNPNNPVSYNVLGDTYVLREKFEMAQSAYEKAIMLQPDNFSALNNLAWILATSEDKAFRNPRPRRASCRKGRGTEAFFPDPGYVCGMPVSKWPDRRRRFISVKKRCFRQPEIGAILKSSLKNSVRRGKTPDAHKPARLCSTFCTDRFRQPGCSECPWPVFQETLKAMTASPAVCRFAVICAADIRMRFQICRRCFRQRIGPVDHLDLFADFPLNHGRQKRIGGAGQNERVYLAGLQGNQVFFYDHGGYRFFQPSFFDKGNQQRTGCGVNAGFGTLFPDFLRIEAAFDNRTASDNADATDAGILRAPGSPTA